MGLEFVLDDLFLLHKVGLGEVQTARQHRVRKLRLLTCLTSLLLPHAARLNGVPQLLNGGLLQKPRLPSQILLQKADHAPLDGLLAHLHVQFEVLVLRLALFLHGGVDLKHLELGVIVGIGEIVIGTRQCRRIF